MRETGVRCKAAGVLLLCTCFLLIAARGALAQSATTPVGNTVRGRALLNAFRDSLPQYSGNRLRCTSCHLDEGTRANAMPWLNTAVRYPKYRSRRGAEETLTQRVNECVTRSLAGRALPENGSAMRDILAYLDSLGALPRPAAPDTVKLVGDLLHGKRVYTTTCVRCHAVDGRGVDKLAPAVWGARSYSIGAGLARQTVLATFLRENMPYDRATQLTAQDAADVAAYVLANPRQDHPGKERDWPKGDPPMDVAYATNGARDAGKLLPPTRAVLRRRVFPIAPATVRTP